jgi:hypothetical protein
MTISNRFDPAQFLPSISTAGTASPAPATKAEKTASALDAYTKVTVGAAISGAAFAATGIALTGAVIAGSLATVGVLAVGALAAAAVSGGVAMLTGKAQDHIDTVAPKAMRNVLTTNRFTLFGAMAATTVFAPMAIVGVALSPVLAGFVGLGAATYLGFVASQVAETRTAIRDSITER